MNLKNLFVSLMFFNFGLGLMAFLSFNFLFLIFSVLGLVVGIFLVFSRKLSWKFGCVCFLCFLLGALRFLVYDYNFRLRALKFDGSDVVVYAKVVDVKKFDNGYEGYVCQVSCVGGENLFFPISVNVNGGKNFKFNYGDEIVAAMKFSAIANLSSNFGFNYNKSKNVYLKGKILKLFDVFEGNGLLVKFFNIRTSLVNAIDNAMEDPANCLANAIFFGQGRKLPYNLHRSFSRCGLAHIFAVSGLHISILFAALFYLLKKLKLTRELSFFILMLFLLCYNMLLGFCISAIRASVMNLAYFLGYQYRKKINAIHSLGFTACLILIIWPNAVFSCSFMLSFSSCLGIVLFFKPISKFICEKFLWFAGFRKMIIELFAISVSAMIFSSFFVAIFFGQISLIAPLVNLIVVPFIPMIMLFSGCVAFSSFLNFEYLTKFFAYCCEGVFFEITTLVDFCAKLPFCCLPMGYFIAPFIILSLIVFLTFVFFYARSLFFSKLVSIFCMLIIFVPMLTNYAISRDASYISCVGNGVGFSIVIKSLDKIIVLCCGGSVGCEKKLCKFLDSKGISKIDFLILLPNKANRINYDVLAIVDCFKTFCVMIPELFQNSKFFKLLLEKGTYLILEEQARFENFPVFVDFLSSCEGPGYNCYINIGGLDFAYCCSSNDFIKMERMKFANVFIVDDEVDYFDSRMNCGFLISLKSKGVKHSKVANLAVTKTTEYVIHGSYLKEGSL